MAASSIPAFTFLSSMLNHKRRSLCPRPKGKVQLDEVLRLCLAGWLLTDASATSFAVLAEMQGKKKERKVHQKLTFHACRPCFD